MPHSPIVQKLVQHTQSKESRLRWVLPRTIRVLINEKLQGNAPSFIGVLLDGRDISKCLLVQLDLRMIKGYGDGLDNTINFLVHNDTYIRARALQRCNGEPEE